MFGSSTPRTGVSLLQLSGMGRWPFAKPGTGDAAGALLCALVAAAVENVAISTDTTTKIVIERLEMVRFIADSDLHSCGKVREANIPRTY